MKINIRKATPKDYHKLLVLFEEVDKLHRKQLPHIFKKPKKPSWSKEYLFGRDSIIFIAETGDKELMGLIHGLVKTSKPKPILVKRKYVFINALVVVESHRRQGIGKKLLKRADEWIKNRGINQIELSVYQFNQPAINFYKKRGYKIISHNMGKRDQLKKGGGK